MLTEHVRLCAQYGIDVTKMTQVEAYVKLVECLIKFAEDITEEDGDWKSRPDGGPA